MFPVVIWLSIGAVLGTIAGIAFGRGRPGGTALWSLVGIVGAELGGFLPHRATSGRPLDLDSILSAAAGSLIVLAIAHLSIPERHRTAQA
jgi:uncharacterized membrane protein YeaQ/YmgE (transglycosylase-associated protein family)